MEIYTAEKVSHVLIHACHKIYIMSEQLPQWSAVIGNLQCKQYAGEERELLSDLSILTSECLSCQSTGVPHKLMFITA